MELGGQIRRGVERGGGLVGGGDGLLVRVVHAFVRAAGDDFDVGFLAVAVVEEGARYCAGDATNLHHCAHAAVEDGLVYGVDFGAEDGRGGLPPWYLELQSAVCDSYVLGSVILRVGRGADVVGADVQRVAWEDVGDGEIDA